MEGTFVQTDVQRHSCGSYQVAFPYSPYDTQRTLVSAILSALENMGISILESPTGTGKTLCVISAVLHWFHELYTGKRNLPWPLPGVKDKRSTDEDGNIPFFVRQWDAQRGLEKLRDFISNKEGIRKRKRGLIKPYSVLSKRDNVSLKNGALCENDFSGQTPEISSDDESNITSTCYLTPKLIFTSRTHSQLGQFITELRKSPYLKLFRVSSVPLASRLHLCLNKNVRSSHGESIADLNNACHDLGMACPYHNLERENQLAETVISKPHTLEDIENLGSATHTCAYYATRRAVAQAQIVLTPYNTLLDAHAREECGLHLTGSVVIIDEAHNLISSCHAALSKEICLGKVEKIRCCLSDALQKQGQLTKTREKLFELKRICDSFYSFFNAASYSANSRTFQQNTNLHTVAFNVGTFLKDIKLVNHDFLALANFCRESTLVQQLARSAPLDDLTQFLSLLASETGDMVVLHTPDANCLALTALSGRRAFTSLLEEALCVILIGGTMPPQSILDAELFSASALGNRSPIRISLPHVIPRNHVCALCVTSGPTQTSMRFTHAAKQSGQDTEMALEAGRSVRNLVQIVPKGIVLFFASFSHLDFVYKVWESNGICLAIEAKKKIFREHSGANLTTLLEQYRTTISNSENGALLCSVMGGRLSEGINFEDDYCRLVVIIGLPYPNPHDTESKARLQYLQNQNPSISEANYYDALCMTTVNQTIGRAIRHRGDYAAILFLDERMSQPKLQSLLPHWIQENITQKRSDTSQCALSFSTAFATLREFFSSFRNFEK